MPQKTSYHLLAAALQGPPPDPLQRFARAVRQVVDGFISHEADLQVASRAARQRWSPARLEQQAGSAIEADAHPLADLLLGATDAASFACRWNGFKQMAPLGAARSLALAPAVHLQPAHGREEAASELRAQLAAACVARLLPPGGGGQPRRQDRAHRLAEHMRRLGVRCAESQDSLDSRYAQPSARLADCARAVGASHRTLQRSFTRAGVSFQAMRQAVRLTLAGHAMRTGCDSLTGVAQLAGFFDSAHFVRARKRACGITPSQYRRLAQS